MWAWWAALGGFGSLTPSESSSATHLLGPVNTCCAHQFAGTVVLPLLLVTAPQLSPKNDSSSIASGLHGIGFPNGLSYLPMICSGDPSNPMSLSPERVHFEWGDKPELRHHAYSPQRPWQTAPTTFSPKAELIPAPHACMLKFSLIF